jgi:hypothetical protein
VRHLFYSSGLKGSTMGSTSTALLVSPPSSETCGGSLAAAAGARGGGVGGVASGGSLVGVTRVSGPAAGGGLSGIGIGGGTGCVTGRSHGALGLGLATAPLFASLDATPHTQASLLLVWVGIRGWDCAREIFPFLHFPRTPSNYKRVRRNLFNYKRVGAIWGGATLIKNFAIQ